MYVVIVREPKPADATWARKARRRYHRRNCRPVRITRFWKAMRELNREVCLAFECAHQAWVHDR